MSPSRPASPEPKLVGDLEIAQWIDQRYGFAPHPFWISHCKEIYILGSARADRLPRHQCPPDKRPAIRAALCHFGMLRETA